MPSSRASKRRATFIISVRSSFARDNLQHRLYRTIRRVLHDVYGSPVELQFEVHKQQPEVKVEVGDDMPLFQYMAQRAMPSPTPAPLYQQVPSPDGLICLNAS